MIVLGKQLEDPYSVENMSKAYASLYGTKDGRTPVEMTDVYVRFLPEGDGQYERLEGMGVRMIDHPVDYEILKEGDYYHDPSVPQDDITWQYAVVSKNFVFPKDIRYERLEECCIPDNLESTKSAICDWAEVERVSYGLTGNGSLFAGPVVKGGSVCPSGVFTLEDDSLSSGEEGLSEVMVCANQFVKIAVGYTDEEGRYKLDKNFTAEPRYRLVFRNKKGFGIGINMLLVPASVSTLGTGPVEGVSMKIDRNSDRSLFCRAVVNNAVADYFNSCVSGESKISLPPANLRIWIFQNLGSSSSPMLQQGAAIDNSLIGEYLGEYARLVKIFLPDITLGLSGCEDYASIYSVVQHECAHSSHFSQVGTAFWDKYIEFILTSFVTSGFITYGIGNESDRGWAEVGEMWAYYLQTVLCRDRYGSASRIYGTSWWFYPQILLYLDERGINRFRIFQAMTADALSRDMLQAILLDLYPEYKKIINQAFARYTQTVKL